MKVKLKPWQIGLIAAAGVVVLGGAGTGIYFGVNRSIDDARNEKLNAALETTTDVTTEPALDEPSTLTPTQPTTKSSTEEKECSTAPQTTREPETVLVYVEPTTEEPITWDPEPDPELSREVSRLMSEKFPDRIWDPSISHPAYPENHVENNKIVELNDYFSFVGKFENCTAQDIVSAWTECDLNRCIMRYNIVVYRYRGPGEGYVFASVREYW